MTSFDRTTGNTELGEQQLDQVSGGNPAGPHFPIETTLSIGSQSSGAGAGKVTFNPFSITKQIDKASPNLF